MLHPVLKSHLPVIRDLFKVYRVKSAYAFGSVVTAKFNNESDIDLLIDFEDDIDLEAKGKMWWDLHDALRDTLNREIDLVVSGSLKNPYLTADINEKKQLIYAA